jgi:hypothetical protein
MKRSFQKSQAGLFAFAEAQGGFFTAKQEGRQGGESYQMVGMARSPRQAI